MSQKGFKGLKIKSLIINYRYLYRQSRLVHLIETDARSKEHRKSYKVIKQLTFVKTNKNPSSKCTEMGFFMLRDEINQRKYNK